LNQQKKNVKIASEYINKALEYVFYCEGRLTVEVKEDVYYIKSSGHPVKTSEISSGERNIIALCYFFTQILREQADKEAYKKEYLLIIDDPVSSFDFENKVGIQSFLKSQASKILSGNQNSRIVWMSHDLSTIYALHKVSEEMKKHLKTGAAIHNVLELENKKLISLDVRKRNEYTHLMKNIYRYATKEDENDLIIGNVMRRALEAFSTFEFKKGFVELSCDRDLLSTLGDRYVDYFENFMYRLVLHGESHYEEEIKTLPDMNFFGFISAEEKVRTAKDVLCLMYLFNKNHVEAHLLGIDGATDNIENWCESITEM
jgi:wobble nucleotide-excising tRNase